MTAAIKDKWKVLLLSVRELWAVSRLEGCDAYEWAFMRAVGCPACAGVIQYGDRSLRASVLLRGHAGCGGWAAPAAQSPRLKWSPFDPALNSSVHDPGGHESRADGEGEYLSRPRPGVSRWMQNHTCQPKAAQARQLCDLAMPSEEKISAAQSRPVGHC